MFDTDEGGNGNNQWSVVEKRKRKKSNASETDSENGTHLTRRRKEEYKVVMKFENGSVQYH